MWARVRTPLLFLSLGMNIAFVIVVVVFFSLSHSVWNEDEVLYSSSREQGNPKSWKKKHDRNPGWYFYRQKIGVSDTQWERLRPDMQTFHSRAYEICKQIRALRNEVLELIESPEPNRRSIRQKEDQIIQLKQKKQRMFHVYMESKKKFLNPDQQNRLFGYLREGRDCDRHARFLQGPAQSRDGTSRSLD